MFRFHKTIFLLCLALFACAPQPAPTATLTATPIPPTITPTAPVITATSTLAPIEATATPKVVNMTIDDWKKFFSGKFTSKLEGIKYDFAEFIDTKHFRVHSDPNLDYDFVKNLTIGTPLMICYPSGEIVIFNTPSTAAEALKNGAYVVSADAIKPQLMTNLAIIAANRDYLEGKGIVTIEFGQIPWASNFKNGGISLSIERDILIEEINGELITPIIKVPKYAQGYNTQTKMHGKLFSESELLNINTTTNLFNWIKPFVDGGYDDLSIEPSD